MFALIKKLWNDESGATAVEYGIMVALIAAVLIVTVGTIGERLLAAFKHVETELGSVAPGGE